MDYNSRIYVAGHTGLVGSAVMRELERRGYEVFYAEHKYNDLRDINNVMQVLSDFEVEYVFNCAAHAGGIKEAIDNPAEMLIDNLRIQANVIDACKDVGVVKLLNFASSCIYPVDGPQPYKEEQIGDGKTDENWSYAVAKLAGVELCRAYHRQHSCNFINVIPCNVYGINDNFTLDKSHVIPALIRKFHEANGCVDVWGGGKARREFIYSDDLARICVDIMERYDYEDLHDGVLNIGTGMDVSVDAIIDLLNDVSGKSPGIRYNLNKPGGVPSKLMDITRMRGLGLDKHLETPLRKGLERVYEWYKNSRSS